MSGRFWFYLTSVVIIIGLYTTRIAVINSLNNTIAKIEQTSRQERIDNLRRYAANTQDERKLVSLAKKIRYEDKEILQTLIDRAYELNPNSRDITILASEFHPELKSKILQLDPLYKGE